MGAIRWAYRYLRNEILSLPTRTGALLGVLGLLALPLFNDSPYLLRVLIMTMLFALYAASWDLLSGIAGQVSFGHSVFFGVAAYATALLNTRLDWSPFLTIPLGALAAVVTGLVVGVPALRLKGPYLALATLSLPIILMGIVFAFPDLTGGELGISGLDRLFADRVALYYFTLVLTGASVFALWKLADSKLGLLFHAIREDEIPVRAAGLNTTLLKLLAFSLSGLFAGMAGGVYAHVLRVVGPSTLEFTMSFLPVIYTIFGGVATIYGPVVGAFVLYPLMEALQPFPEFRMLTFALVVILVLRFMPQGVTYWLRYWLERDCPRCKVPNAPTRQQCRVCGADLVRAAPAARAVRQLEQPGTARG